MTKVKFSQKARWFLTGAVAVVVTIPLTLRAVDTIPLTFNEGDLLSANVLNILLGRVNDVQNGFTSEEALLGIWSCTTYALDTGSGGCSGGSSTPKGLLTQRTQNITFSQTGNVFSWSSTFAPGTCESDVSKTSANFELLGGTKIASIGAVYKSINNINKVSPTKFVWDINGGISGGGTTAYVVCTMNNQPPDPVNNLKATASGTTTNLTWVDQSADETGFKIQRRLMSAETFGNVTTVATNVISYSDVGLTAGTYVYRVLATNANGDSISSSEVSVVVQ